MLQDTLLWLAVACVNRAKLGFNVRPHQPMRVTLVRTASLIRLDQPKKERGENVSGFQQTPSSSFPPLYLSLFLLLFFLLSSFSLS